MLRRFPVVTLLPALAAAGVYLVSGDAALHLQFERDANEHHAAHLGNEVILADNHGRKRDVVERIASIGERALQATTHDVRDLRHRVEDLVVQIGEIFQQHPASDAHRPRFREIDDD